MELQQVPYLAGGRELCVTGACILTAADDLLGRAIRFFEGGRALCSHAAPVVRFPSDMMDAERVTLIQALEHGLTATFASEFLEGFRGRVFLFTPAGLTPEIQARFRAWMLTGLCSRVPYDYLALFRQILGHTVQDAHAQFCSEAYGIGLEQAGLPRRAPYVNGLAPQPADIPEWWPGRLVELVEPFGSRRVAA